MWDSELSLKALMAMQRNYDMEWTFITEMEQMQDLAFDHIVMVIDCDPILIGENWILVYEGVNDNAIGVL